MPASINIRHPQELAGNDLIDFYLPSEPVVVGGPLSASSMFGKDKALLDSLIVPGKGYIPDEKRGIPPNNWAKFKDNNGNDLALFSYKTVHRCIQNKLGNSMLVDQLSLVDLRRAFNDEPGFYMARTGVAKRVSNIHTVTTQAKELYVVESILNNITSISGAHADVRIIPFNRDCPYLLRRDPGLNRAQYVIVGSVHDKNWQERQFLGIVDENMDLRMRN